MVDNLPKRWPVASRITSSTLTFDTVCTYYLVYLKDRPSYPNTRRLIRSYFACWVGRDAYSITRGDVFRWHQDIGRTATGAANKALATLRSMYNRAIESGLFKEANPTLGVKRFHRLSRKVRLEAG